jgi:hypothetical protein
VRSGDPWGGVGFSMPGEGIGYMVDSEEEMFSGVKSFQQSAAEKQEKDAVKLVFPLLTGQLGVEEQWPWNICGG